MPEKGKAKALLAAYQVAAEGHDLQYFKTMLDEHAAAMQADIEAKEARDAEKAAKAAKADKKRRKSEAKADEDVDMEDADADPEPKKSSKKRKKEVDSDDEESEKVSAHDCILDTTKPDSDSSLQRLQRPRSS